jgi:hypothetical protein
LLKSIVVVTPEGNAEKSHLEAKMVSVPGWFLGVLLSETSHSIAVVPCCNFSCAIFSPKIACQVQKPLKPNKPREIPDGKKLHSIRYT